MHMKKIGWLVLLGVLSMSISGPMVKMALLAGATPVTIALLRMAVTAAILAIPAWRTGDLLRMVRAPWKWKGLAILASAFLAVHYAVWMTSLQKTGTFASMALVCTQPLFVAAFSGIVLGERMPRQAVPGAVLAVLGAVSIGLLSMTGRGGDAWGDLLALAGAVTMAGYWLCSRAVRRYAPALGYMEFVYVCTALFLALLLPLMGGFAAPPASLLPIGLVIVVCTLGGHALFTYVLGYVSADVVSFALLGEPIGAALWALLLFNEQVSWQMALGGGLIIVGLWLYLWGTARAARAQ